MDHLADSIAKLSQGRKTPMKIASSPNYQGWNDLPDSLISSAELSGDCVSKFTSLVRARD